MRCAEEIDHNGQHVRCFKRKRHVKSKRFHRSAHEAYIYIAGATFNGGTVEWTAPSSDNETISRLT